MEKTVKELFEMGMKHGQIFSKRKKKQIPDHILALGVFTGILLASVVKNKIIDRETAGKINELSAMLCSDLT